MRAPALLAIAAIALSGCATVRGSQDAPAAFAAPKTMVTYDAALLNYGQPLDSGRAGMTREQYRDYVVDLYLVDIENKYRRFKKELTHADRGSALAGDLVLLGLSGATALVGPSAVQELATATAVATGARAAIDKRLFFDRTLPAVIAAIDARRARIKAEIVVRRRLPLSQYTLGEAMDDLTRLADAGSLSGGIGDVTAAATATKEAEEAQLRSVQEGCSKADAGTRAMNDEFRTLLLVDPALQPGRLDEAAKLLGMPADAQPLTYAKVAQAFRGKFCGDVGKRAFIDMLTTRIATREGK
jgi:hypothetical protein